MSHDLRGHLNSVLLMVELLRRDLGPRPGFEEQTADLDSMKRSLLDTVTCVDRLVCAERLRLGLIKPKPGAVDLASLVPPLRNQYQIGAADRGATLDISATGEALADRHLIALGVGCLIANAIDHGRGNMIKVELEGRGVAWHARVKDGGAGGAGGTGGAGSAQGVGGAGGAASGVGGGSLVSPQASAILDEDLDPSTLVPGGPMGLRLTRHIAHLLGARLTARVESPWTLFEIAAPA